MITRKPVDLAILALVAIMIAGCQDPGVGTGTRSEALPNGILSEPSTAVSAKIPPTRDGEVQPPPVLQAHFQATFYEVQAVAERLTAVDSKVLAKRATSAEDLLRALSDVGTVRILYRFDQSVNVFSEKLRIGTVGAIVTGASSSARKQATSMTVEDREVGAIIRLSACMPSKEAKRKGPAVTVSAELTVLVASDIEIVPGHKATPIQFLSLENTQELEFGQPRVMLAVNSASTDEKQPPVMYVISYVFNQ